MKNFIIIILGFVVFASCGKSNKDKSFSLLQKWIGKELSLPARSVFTIQGKDTVEYSIQNTYKILQLFLNTLYMISETDKNLDLILSIFEIKLLCLLGFMPVIDKCVNCGEKEELKYFSLKDNGFKCSACGKQDKGAIEVSKTTENAIKYIVMAPAKKIFSFNISEENITQLKVISKLYLNSKLEKEYKLKINEKKTWINNIKYGFNFLGYTYKVIDKKTIIKIKRSNIDKIKKRIKEVKYLFNTGKMGYYNVFCSIMTYSNSYKYADDRKIKRLIDKYWYNEK